MLDYQMDKRGDATLYEYLYQQIRDDILAGTIAAGERLPSKRRLAEHLGISLITVEAAYDQLIAEGYAYALPRRGYYVNELPRLSMLSAQGVADLAAAVPGRGAVASPAQPPAGRIASFSNREAADRDVPAINVAAAGSAETPRYDFASSRSIAADAGARLWSKAVRAALVSEPESELYSPAPAQGAERLRAAIAHYLKSNRGMDIDTACIVVGAGAQVLNIQLAQLFGTTRTFAVEDPGYLRLTRIYQALGARVRHIGMDAQGIRVDELAGKQADVVHFMPSHQFPTGRVTSIARRYELLGWAASDKDRYVIEDDYDCEFRLAGRPIPSLASIDATQRVVYTNTFSRSLSAALRLAYMVLPPELMERYSEELGFYSSSVSTVDQIVLARLLEDGSYERHVNRIRKRQRDARDRLCGALRQSDLADRACLEEADAGLHAILSLDDDRSEQELTQLALDRGVRIEPLSSFVWCSEHAAASDGRPRFMVQYGGVPQEDLGDAVAALETAWA